MLEDVLSEAGQFSLDVLAEYFGKNGTAAFSNALQKLGYGETAVVTAFEENPIKAGAAMILGLAAVAYIGPEVTATGAIATLVETYEGFGIPASLAPGFASATINSLSYGVGETLYSAVQSTLSALVKAIGGTLTTKTIDNGSCIITPNQTSTGSNLLLLIPGVNDTIEQYFIDFPYTVPGIDPNSLNISTDGTHIVTLDPGAWSKVSYNGAQLVANLLSSTNQADGALRVNSQRGQGVLTSASGQTLFNISGNLAFDVKTSNGAVTINLGTVPAGNLQSTIDGVSEHTDGSLSFSDALGKDFANYASGQLTGGSIKLNDNEIDVYNANHLIQNSTQDLALGGSNVGALDKNYYYLPAGVSTIDATKGTGDTYANGINDLGQIVGISPVLSPGIKGYIDNNGAFTALQIPGYDYVTASSINDSGQVVGTYIQQSTGTPNQAFLYQNGKFLPLAIPNSQASAINNKGDIVGDYYLNGNSYGFLDHNGAISTITAPWFQSAQINQSTLLSGINDAGQIVGAFFSSSGEIGFVESNGIFSKLQFPGATRTVPHGINNDGEIVGDYYDANGNYFPFSYKDGQYTALNIFGSTNVAAMGINNLGQIVGICRGSSGHFEGFLYTPSQTSQTSSTLQISGSGTIDLRTQPAAPIGSPTTINLAAGNNTVYFGGALETVVSAGGTNSYNFTVGDGADIIENSVASASTASGALNFLGGVSWTKVDFTKNGQNLIASVEGTPDEVTIQNWFDTAAAQLHTIKAGNWVRLSDTNGVISLNDTTAQIANDAHVFSGAKITVYDSAINVGKSLNLLQTFGASGQLTAIHFTNAQTPTLAVTDTQLTSDSGALSKIADAFHELVRVSANVTETVTATGTENIISFAGATNGVWINLNAGKATQISMSGGVTTTYTDTLKNFQNAVGSLYDDHLAAGSNGSVLTGNGGKDIYILNAKGTDIVKDSAAHLDGSTINGLSSLDQIDLTNMAFGASSTFGFVEDKSNTFGTLTVSDGTHTAAIKLMGQFDPSKFYEASNGNRGEIVTYGAPLPAVTPASPQPTVASSEVSGRIAAAVPIPALATPSPAIQLLIQQAAAMTTSSGFDEKQWNHNGIEPFNNRLSLTNTRALTSAHAFG